MYEHKLGQRKMRRRKKILALFKNIDTIISAEADCFSELRNNLILGIPFYAVLKGTQALRLKN